MRLYRLKQVATTLNIGTSTIVDFLSAKGIEVENKPTTKITEEHYNLLAEELAFEIDKVYKSKEYITQFSNLIFINPEENRRNVISDFLSETCTATYSDRYFNLIPRLFGFDCSHIKPSQLDLDISLFFNDNSGSGREIEKQSCIQSKLTLDEYAQLIKEHAKQCGKGLKEKIEFCNTPKVEVYKESIAYLGSYSTDSYDSEFFSFEDIAFLISEIKYDRNSNIADAKAALLHRVKGVKQKQYNLNFKTKIHSIITPRLFHVFTDEEDNNRVAVYYHSLSVGFFDHLREACLNIIGFKTRLNYARLTYIN